MKRILYSLLVVISSFIFIDNVSAVVSNFSATSTTISENIINMFSRSFPASQTLNLEVIENGLLDSYGQYYFCSAYTSWSSLDCYVSNSVNDFGAYFANDGSVNIVYTYTAESTLYKLNLKNGFVSSSSTVTTVQNSTSIGGSYISYVQITNIPYFKMLRPSDIYDSVSTIKTDDGYSFNRGDVLIYNDNGTFVLNVEYKTVDDLFKEPEPYIFDEYIYDYNYSQMIFDFDLSILEERENVFDLLLNDFYVENEIRDTILYDVERFDISYPYFEYETSDGYRGILYLKDLDGNDIISKKKMYTGKYLDSLPDDTVSLRFIVSLRDTVEHRLKLSFITYYPFTISYITDEQIHSYRETIDLSNKYGVMFIPKLVENNSDIMSSFETWGIEKVLVYDTYDYKTQPIETYTDDITTFDYTFKYINMNYNLFFITDIKKSYSAVEYDTRYFTYHVVDNKFSFGTIINPNTNDRYYTDFSNTSNLESNFDSIADVFYFIADKIDTKQQSYILFKNSVGVFFNTMPNDIYILILSVLAIILIGTTLALGGWK